MAQAKYARLDKVLRSLGFSVRTWDDPKAKIYEHKESGALIALPPMAESDAAQPRHLAAVRAVLDAYSISDPTVWVWSCRRRNFRALDRTDDAWRQATRPFLWRHHVKPM